MVSLEQANAFLNYFSVKIATLHTDKTNCYRIRYDTFVEEFGFEDKANYNSNTETDEYDFLSTSIIIYHNRTNKPAACVRVIPGFIFDKLPIEKYLNDALDPDKCRDILNNREYLCEISRLAVSKEFRKRKGEEASPLGSSVEEERSYPLLAVACFLTAAIIAESIDTTTGIAVMEPFLPRLTHRSGIHFEPIGTEVEYHGKRIPYTVNHKDIVKNMSPALKFLYEQIRLELINELMFIY